MKFLVDECLSPESVEIARLYGHLESTHVTWLGLTSAKDWTIARRAVDEGFIFVTNNTADFSTLYGREDLHVGLVCLNAAAGMMSLALQRRLFLLASRNSGEPSPTIRSLRSRPSRPATSTSADTTCLEADPARSAQARSAHPRVATF